MQRVPGINKIKVNFLNKNIIKNYNSLNIDEKRKKIRCLKNNQITVRLFA